MVSPLLPRLYTEYMPNIIPEEYIEKNHPRGEKVMIDRHLKSVT